MNTADNKMPNLHIIGAGGFGREVAWLVERINQKMPTWNLRGFIDDNEALWGRMCGGYPILGGIDFLNTQRDARAVCAIGSASTRKKIIEAIDTEKVQFAALIDPSVITSERVSVGEGTIICAGTILTVDIQIGKHVILNLDCTIGHDVHIGDFVTAYPSVNISGAVNIGMCSELGTGAHIIQGISIPADTILGAGAVVVKDITLPGTYVGVPAVLKRKQ